MLLLHLMYAARAALLSATLAFSLLCAILLLPSILLWAVDPCGGWSDIHFL